MSVGRRLNSYSGMRLDVPHIRSIESATSYDFDSVLRGMFTGINRPYLIRGFKLNIPSAAIDASSLTIQVADSAVLHSSATESGTILLTAPGLADEQLSSSNPNVIGSFQSNAINYVALDYRRVTDPNTVDQTAGWSPSQQLEFQRAVPIGRILQYRFVITTNGYGTNLPLFQVKTNINGAFEWATKGVPSLFRLGSGGPNPNPQNNFNWGNYTNPQAGVDPRREWVNVDPTINSNPLTVGPGAPVNAFDFGDFSITNFKDWMDAIMTRFKELTGSDYWYTGSRLPNGDPTVFDLWWDSIGSVMTGAGDISYNLVLESSSPTLGKFQQPMNDPEIQSGDVYVEGTQSGTKASLTSYNNTQLIINSMTSAAFAYGEPLRTRRLYRPATSQWQLSDYGFAGDRYARFKRMPTLSGANTATIVSWGYQRKATATKNLFSIVTVQTSAPHGFNTGDFVNISGLNLSISTAPNGVARIADVPSATSFSFYTTAYLDGTTSVSAAGARLDGQIRNPLSPAFAITAYEPDTGTQVKVTVPEHTFAAPQSVVTTMSSGVSTMTVTSTAGLKLGMSMVHANIPATSRIVSIDALANTVDIFPAPTASASSVAVSYREGINVYKVVSAGYTDDQLNGFFPVLDVNGSNQVIIDIGVTFAPTATTLVGATMEPVIFDSILSVTGAGQDPYNVTNVQFITAGGSESLFIVGPDTLPPLNPATGSYEMDAAISMSTVLDPVVVQSITNDGIGNLTVTTVTPHGLVSGGPLTFTIYGDQQLSRYIRTYTNVNIVVVDPNTYNIVGTGLIGTDSFTNSGTDKVFSKFADNPYPGPVQWTSDIVIKGIVGDYGFIIPQSAVIDTADLDNDPLANNFNVNGVTGTAYLQDGEVLFAKLERNQVAGNGATYTTAGASSVIFTSGIITDKNGNPLDVGDWIKWQDEDESKWLKIKTINPAGFTLETDNDQDPDITQRPAKSGVIVYSKGSYPKLYVKKHHLVDTTADIYWLAVRRDNNGGKSKVYFRSLEVEAGEVRQVNDNTTSNVLAYTGMASEGESNPNYSVKGQGDWAFATTLTIESVDNLTRMVTFIDDPEKGFQREDRFIYDDGSALHYFTVRHVLSSRTVVVKEDTTALAALVDVTYNRVNQFIQDQDNLTVALRKEDRQAGHVDTALQRPIYDETVYIQQMNLSGSGTVRSGSYVYTGSITNPTALGWVLHGNAVVTETIETAAIAMPGGHLTVGPNAILVHVYYGSFNDGDGLNQNGTATGRTVNNPGNPAFAAPAVYGAPSGGVEIVLPANRRTQVVGTGYVVYGTHSFYKASADPVYAGEELLVMVNDGIRQAVIDYIESFGGPKGKVQLIRNLPPNSRMRFRVQSSFGSAIAAKSADASLQSAYNIGATILTSPNRPVEITASDVVSGETALIARGSVAINGGPNQAGGIFNELGDQGFVIGREDNKPKETWTGLDAVKSQASHPDSAWKRKTAAQTVTGAAPTVLTDSAIQMVEGQAYRIKMSAVARRSDGTLGVSSIVLEGTFYMQGGVVYAAGSPISTINGTAGDGYAYAAAFGIQGTTIVMVVYGTTGSTLQWAIGMDWQAVGVA